MLFFYFTYNCKIICFVIPQVKKSSDSFAGAESAVKSADKKLIFVPVIFIMLRIWNVIADPIAFFCRRQLLVDHKYVSLAAVAFKVNKPHIQVHCAVYA